MEKRKLLKVSPLTVAAVQMNVELGDKKKKSSDRGKAN